MPVSNQSETIDPRILRLIGLDDVFDLDYETYFTLLREALVKANMPGKSIPTEEFEMLSNEIKRVKSKKDDGRFEVKKKKITAGSLGLNIGKSTKLLPPVGAIAKSPMGGDLAQGISEIKEVMVSILETLKLQQKADKDTTENERRKAEKEKRGLAEDKLEKRFEGIKKAAEKIIAPVKSLFDRLFQFIGTVLLGRIVFKLIEWLGDKNNADKVRSLLRFFGDHWPKLLALYIAFGTSFGKFARGLISLVVKGTAALVRATAGLAAKVIGGKLGGRLGKVAGFLGGGKGKLAVAGVEAIATIGGTLALSKGLENFSGIGGEEKAQGLAGGGYVRPRFPAFGGGGFNFKGMMGGIFGSGYVSGEKGVDKVPAMLSDGEFVMSVGAVQKYGVDTLEAMNAAGGGTNKPKIMSGTTYAAGGGLIGNAQSSISRLNQIEEILSNLISDNKLRIRETGFKMGFARAPENRMLPAAGQSSSPINRAVVPYKSGALAKQSSALSTQPIQQIYTNLNVPGGSTSSLSRRVRPRGYGGALQAAFAAMEFADRKQQGQTTTQAGLGAASSALGGQLGWMGGAKAGAVIGAGVGSLFGGVGAAPGAAIGAILGGVAGGFGGASLGGKLADDLSGVNAAKEKLGRGGIGGAIKGGYGLKKETAKEEFKNAPKTMVMTDDKGRPFVGHKVMKDGKLTYVRPSKPGTGTTNPFEALGRMINPGAYRDSDARIAMKNQKIAMVNSLERFQSQNMAKDSQARMMKQMGGNLKDVQNDLNYRRKTRANIAGATRKPPTINPLPKPQSKYNPAGGGMGGARGSGGGARASGPKTPSFSATNPKASSAKAKTLGVRA